MKIYLSPSNQPNNRYAVGNTTEKIEMEAVAARVKTILDRDYTCETVMATLSMGIGSNERPLEAKNKGCGYYIAIHSNAAGSSPSNATGAVAFFHPDSAKSRALATSAVNELNAVCPIKSNRASHVASGMTQFNGSGYGEIRSPMQRGVVPVLIEVNFHDNPVTARYIIDNKDQIAAAIVKSLVTTLAIGRKSGTPPTPVTPPPTTPTPPASTTTIKKGDTVRIAANAVYFGGKSIPAWVLGQNWIVTSVSGDRAVIDKNVAGTNSINSPINTKFLTVVGAAVPAPSTPATSAFTPYMVRVTASELNIRKGPGTNFGTNGSIKDKGTYTIIEEANGQGAKRWGRLKSGAGWIALDHTQRR